MKNNFIKIIFLILSICILTLIYILYLPYKYYQRDTIKEEQRAMKNINWFIESLNTKSIIKKEKVQKYFWGNFDIFLASQHSKKFENTKGSLTIYLLRKNKDLFARINNSSKKIYYIKTKSSIRQDGVLKAVMITSSEKIFTPNEGYLHSYQPIIIIFPLRKIGQKILLEEIIINGKPLTAILGIKITDEAHPKIPELRLPKKLNRGQTPQQ